MPDRTRSPNDPTLSFLEHAPIAVTVIDAEFRLYGFNQRAAAMFGDPVPATGVDFAELTRRYWNEPQASDIIARYRHTLETGEPYVAPLFTDTRIGGAVAETYDWQIQRVVLADGSFGVASYTHDIALVRQAAEVVAVAARRNRFLVALNDRLRPLADPGEIMTAAAEVLGQTLGVDQVAYAEVGDDGDLIVLTGEYTNGKLAAMNRTSARLSQFGAGFAATLHAGDDVVSEDVTVDPRRPAGGSDTVRAWGVRAGFATPSLKNGKLVSYLYAAHSTPRVWAEWERELVHAVAERTQAEVQRARAEQEVREHERQTEALVDHAMLAIYLVDDRLRILHANALTRAMFGIPDLVGRDLAQILHDGRDPGFADAIVQRVRHTLNTGESYASPETVDRSREGVARATYEWRIDRLPLPSGGFGVVCYARDITAIVREREQRAATEARYRVLFESIDQAVAILDLVFDQDGRPVDAFVAETNPALAHHTGRSDVPGKYLRELQPEVELGWLDACALVAKTGESRRFEGFSLGAGRWFDAYVSRVGTEGSQRVAIVFTNVTERMRAAEQLRQSEERNAYLLKLSDALRTLSDPDEIQRTAVRVLGQQLGASRALYGELSRGPDEEFVTFGPNYCAPSMFALRGRYRARDFGTGLSEVFRAGSVVIIDDVNAHPHIAENELRAYRAIEVRSCIANPMVKEGRPVAFITVHHDTPHAWSSQEVALVEATGERTWAEVERSRAEATLRETEAQLQLALDATGMGTFAWYIADDRVDVDSRALEALGVQAGAPLGLTIALERMIHPDDRARYAAAVREASDPDGPRVLREDIRLLGEEECVRWIEVNGKTLFEDAARPGKLVGTVVDVTERKLTEQALRESEERLREGDRRKDEFIATLAHELRNPLAPIRTGLALIKLVGDEPRALDENLAMIERQVTHMVRLIDDLLDVSRISSGKIQLRREPTPLATMVQSALEANRAAITEAAIALHVDLPPTRTLLDVDPTRCVQVLSNVLHNAVKFTDARGRIDIVGRTEIVRGEERLTLAVTDSGIGITPEMLPRVFDLFAQNGDPSRLNSGLGLGLALSKRLVEMHGGSIEARSGGPGCGSTFTVQLPLAAASAEPTRAALEVGPVEVGRRVVVIDDNVDAANALKQFVAALGGDCRVAYDGERGLEHVAEFRPQLVLLDIGMPRMDGYETCRRIRDLLGSSVTIVAITGWGQASDKLAASKAGFDAHLTKPVDPDVLTRMLANEASVSTPPTSELQPAPMLPR